MKSLLSIFLILTSLAYAQEKTFAVVSQPESCRVYYNGTFRGISPCSITISDFSPEKPAQMKFLKQGCIPQTQQIQFSTAPDTIFVVFERGASILINSIPEGATAFINGEFYGKTPLLIDTLTARPVSITLTKQQYYPYKIDLTIIENQNLHISPVLQPFSTYFMLTSNIEKGEIYLDGKQIGTGSVDSIDAKIGGHTVAIFDPVSGSRKEKGFAINSVGTKRFYAEMRYFSYLKMSYGLILPGLNQFTDGSTITGLAFLGGAVYGLFNYVKAASRYDEKLNVFNIAQNNYTAATDEEQAAITRAASRTAHDDLKKTIPALNVAMVIPALVWALNGFDVITSHSLDDSIIELSENQNIRIMPTKNLASVYINYTITF